MTKASTKFHGLVVTREDHVGYPSEGGNTISLRFSNGRQERVYDVTYGHACLLYKNMLKMGPEMVAHIEAYAQAYAAKIKGAA